MKHFVKRKSTHSVHSRFFKNHNELIINELKSILFSISLYIYTYVLS